MRRVSCSDPLLASCWMHCVIVAAIIRIDALSAIDSIGIFRNCSSRTSSVTKASVGFTVYFTHILVKGFLRRPSLLKKPANRISVAGFTTRSLTPLGDHVGMSGHCVNKSFCIRLSMGCAKGNVGIGRHLYSVINTSLTKCLATKLPGSYR